MRPVSAAFLRAVTGSHQMCARVRAVSGHPVGTDPDGVELAIDGGTVTLDANAEVRGSLDLSVVGLPWPRVPTDPVTPYGTELYVERGVVLGDGTREWVSQGYYRVQDMEQDRVPDGPIRVSAYDRMMLIRDARLTEPVVFGAGSSVELVFETLVLDVYPAGELVFDFNAAATLFDTAHVAEEDRYGFLADVARAHGKVMYYDHEGRLRVVSAPDPSAPVWEVASGAGGVLVSMSRSLSRQDVYNAVVASGEAPGEGEPVRAVARDLEPSSATFWDGPFGRVPRFYSSSFITTNAQASNAAEEMLKRALGLAYNVDFACVPNPAIEPLDPVRVSHPGGSEVHVLEQVSISLSARDALRATTREQSLVNIGVEN